MASDHLVPARKLREPEPARRAGLGAVYADGETSFRLWAPAAQRVELLLELPAEAAREVELVRAADGFFTAALPDLPPGTLYRYRVGGQGPFPDPASRFQPEGVHGRSEVIDPASFWWTDGGWRGIAISEAVIYELHVGTFSPSGTFAGVIDRLPHLKELGVTALELMPLADFPGEQNWGYDGVSLFAPSRAYGRPDDLRRLVDEAHTLGLAVILDVVYNHLGPDGNYLGVYSPHYFSQRHHTPWGAALNFDGDNSRHVREFFIENALHWIHEYHFDGLRLDATHSIVDDSQPHFLAELTERVQSSVTDRQVLIIAEDDRNRAHMIRPQSESGWGLDAVWADGFHHQVRSMLAGDTEGYFGDYTGTAEDLATTIRQGWFYTGQHSRHLDAPRGSDPTGIPKSRFVVCLQNHDQIGNRALGERLHHDLDPAAWRAASALLLLAPQTPLLFMGQEWKASTPFLYFTDHHHELGRQVTAGRREEFKYFAAFADPHAREQIPDPQAASTFLASKLFWDELDRPEHAASLRLYRELLHWRRTEAALQSSEEGSFRVTACGDDAIVLVRQAPGGEAPGGEALLIVVQLQRKGVVDLAARANDLGWPMAGPWEVALTTEEPRFTIDPAPPAIALAGGPPIFTFHRPGAAILRSARHST